MGYVAGHDNGALQVDAGGNGILRQLLAHGVDALVQVDGDGVLALASLGILGRNELRGVCVHLFEPDTVGIDFSLDITVG